jgi:hypothetical protein
MTHNEQQRLAAWFQDYVTAYYCGRPDYDRMIRLKEDHSHRVCANAHLLGRSLDLAEPQLFLAQAAALLHDVGRFEQLARYGTFSDRQSENHALLGLRLLARQRVLSASSPADRRTIARAVAYHNAATLPPDTGDPALLHMRLLRDADKLDIWRVFTEYLSQPASERNPTIELGLPEAAGCTPRILEAFAASRIVAMEDVHCLNDFKLLQISWVFDLNFAASYAVLHNCGYIERLADTLPSDPPLRRAIQAARRYLKKNLP